MIIGSGSMNFYSIRELRTETKNIYENILQNGEAVITNNGKPSMLMINISEDNFDEILRAVRQARAMIAFNSMKMIAAKNNYMSEDEINAEIEKYRSEKLN